ncbi:hypothetical protein LA080_004018 [Diaporthe eres]|nr:hypothetical protein LA080_004018 [Diaporthe eres]
MEDHVRGIQNEDNRDLSPAQVGGGSTPTPSLGPDPRATTTLGDSREAQTSTQETLGLVLVKVTKSTVLEGRGLPWQPRRLRFAESAEYMPTPGQPKLAPTAHSPISIKHPALLGSAETGITRDDFRQHRSARTPAVLQEEHGWMQDMQTEEGERVIDLVFSATRLTQNVDNATNTVFYVILHLQASAPRHI